MSGKKSMVRMMCKHEQHILKKKQRKKERKKKKLQWNGEIVVLTNLEGCSNVGEVGNATTDDEHLSWKSRKKKSIRIQTH